MTGRTNPLSRGKTLRIATGMIVLAFGMGAGHAEEAEPLAQPLALSAEVQFEQAFDHLPEASLDPAIPDHAVDLGDIEPPIEPVATLLGEGVASYYGRKFHGRPTASGEAFDMNAMTAAHRTLPFGSQVRVTNLANGSSVVVKVNDRGPFIRGREIDLSRAAAERIGLIGAGHGNVELELIAS